MPKRRRIASAAVSCPAAPPPGSVPVARGQRPCGVSCGSYKDSNNVNSNPEVLTGLEGDTLIQSQSDLATPIGWKSTTDKRPVDRLTYAHTIELNENSHNIRGELYHNYHADEEQKIINGNVKSFLFWLYCKVWQNAAI